MFCVVFLQCVLRMWLSSRKKPVLFTLPSRIKVLMSVRVFNGILMESLVEHWLISSMGSLVSSHLMRLEPSSCD